MKSNQNTYQAKLIEMEEKFKKLDKEKTLVIVVKTNCFLYLILNSSFIELKTKQHVFYFIFFLN